jgi:pyridoxal phosphate enzyme (YggS family)
MISFETFESNLEQIKRSIKSACQNAGRSVGSVQILPVTKRHPVDAINYAIRAGLQAVGENRVQEATLKKSVLPGGVRWELIGHLQTNKAKDAVAIFDRIQSVDSLKLINRLSSHAEQAGKSLPILIQCNAGKDPNKYGFSVDEMEPALEVALASKNLQVDGLMTIAPLSDNPDVAKAAFDILRDLRDRLAAKFGVPLPELSMGMTGDMEVAIAAGSTQVRVGTALYGPRLN